MTSSKYKSSLLATWFYFILVYHPHIISVQLTDVSGIRRRSVITSSSKLYWIYGRKTLISYRFIILWVIGTTWYKDFYHQKLSFYFFFLNTQIQSSTYTLVKRLDGMKVWKKRSHPNLVAHFYRSSLVTFHHSEKHQHCVTGSNTQKSFAFAFLQTHETHLHRQLHRYPSLHLHITQTCLWGDSKWKLKWKAHASLQNQWSIEEDAIIS